MFRSIFSKILFMLVFFVSCQSSVTRWKLSVTQNKQIFAELFKKEKVAPDTCHNLVVFYLPMVFCEPCKQDVAVYINSLLDKIGDFPQTNILFAVPVMRKKEIPLFFTNDYYVDNYQDYPLVTTDSLPKICYEKYHVLGAFMLAFKPDGSLLLKKQFKQTVAYYNDADSIARIIFKKSPKCQSH